MGRQENSSSRNDRSKKTPSRKELLPSNKQRSGQKKRAKLRHRYDLAFSFAGEDREVVEILANLLSERGVRIFYDRYEQASLWGADLYQHLSHVYKDAARFCVVFVSKNYAKKLWAKHELRQAQARAFSEGVQYILPLRMDKTSLPGMTHTQGYIDLLKTPLEQVVNLLLQKLKLPKRLQISPEAYGGTLMRYEDEMKEDQQRRSFYVVRRYDRVRYGEEKHSDLWRELPKCGDCGVTRGKYHVKNCDLEECPICGGQAWTCDCVEATWKLR